ncbi:hypothetical protein V1L52_03645 [Treponema sp. HNW]|uniref:hypothetical protein n=1 Tax=Treponema sp. HNW TaxID=3116654 RepID=UPI003D0AB281
MNTCRKKMPRCGSEIKAFLCYALFTAFFPLFAFDWPRPAENVGLFFAQKQADVFNRGLIFTNPSEVTTADSGRILITIQNDFENTALFPSTLGTALIVEHKNRIFTVYGGLEKITAAQAFSGAGAVTSRESIGVSGSSGWKKENQSLEFQVIDTHIKAAINPLILMENPVKVKRFLIRNVTAVSKTGSRIPLSGGIGLGAGTYVLYTEIISGTMPYTTEVSVNGTLTEKTDYNALKTHKEKIRIQGSAEYDFNSIYAEKNMLRLAEVALSKGKNTIDIKITDIGGQESLSHIPLSVF